jgi:hypothetical protein
MEREADLREVPLAAAPAVPAEPIVPAAQEIPAAPPVEPVVSEVPAAETPAMPVAAAEDFRAEEELAGVFQQLEGIDIAEADEMALRVAEEIRAEEQQKEAALEEAEEPVFDIMQLLAAEAEKLANVSPIDMMDTYGELVIEITLEELAHYNNAQRSKRRMR